MTNTNAFRIWMIRILFAECLHSVNQYDETNHFPIPQTSSFYRRTFSTTPKILKEYERFPSPTNIPDRDFRSATEFIRTLNNNKNKPYKIMAKIKQGILGGLSGTIGNVVGSRWKGIDYIRSKPSGYKNPNTERQLTQRSKFRLMAALLKSVGPVIKTGFRNVTGNLLPRNRAMSLNLKSAISGTYPNLTVEPSELQFSEGTLPGAEDASADLSVTGTATFSWTDNSGNSSSASNDVVITVLYNTDKDMLIYRINEHIRSDETANMNLPADWSGDQVATYLLFASVENTEVSDTQYLGTQSAA